MPEDYQKQSDHDLLVKIHTQVERVIIDVKEIRDNTTARVENLEREKFDKSEATKVLAEANLVHDNLDTRVKWLERIAYTGLGLLAALEFYFRLLK